MKRYILIFALLLSGCNREMPPMTRAQIDTLKGKTWTVMAIDVGEPGGFFKNGREAKVIFASDGERQAINPCTDSFKGLLVGDKVTFTENAENPYLGVDTCTWVTVHIVK